MNKLLEEAIAAVSQLPEKDQDEIAAMILEKISSVKAIATPSIANRDARLRAVIHLAYYAAFNLAKDYLRVQEGHSIPKTGDVHAYVAEQFDISPDPVRKLVAKDLKKLRKFGNQADYVPFFPGLSSFARTCITLAEEVISTLSSL